MDCSTALALILLHSHAAMPLSTKVFHTQFQTPQIIYVADKEQISPLSKEPLYADIVGRAKMLKSRVEAMADKARPDLITSPAFQALSAQIKDLSDLDMKAHLDLKARGTDGDLKCILRGISQDLLTKMEALKGAKDAKSLKDTLLDMSYLLNDNVEVITTPPAVQSGLEGVK